MITPRAAGGNVQFCGMKKSPSKVKKPKFRTIFIMYAKVNPRQAKALRYRRTCPLLLYHNLQAGIVDGHDSVLVVIRYRQRSTAFISAYEISLSASFEQDKHFYTLHKSERSRTNENIFVTFAAD
ncbi:hypothetical protein [Bacteroides sp.]|uniref:hypothetical protein n=1 Tax=Bacteroides sp. TaxID=29523 RepID=UPI0025BB2354|nr:hypothetical protein [Bacteroides sp.]